MAMRTAVPALLAAKGNDRTPAPTVTRVMEIAADMGPAPPISAKDRQTVVAEGEAERVGVPEVEASPGTRFGGRAHALPK